MYPETVHLFYFAYMSLPQCFTIETERLILRALTPDIYDELFANGTDDEIVLFLGINNEDLEEEKQRQALGRNTWRTSFVNFTLTEKVSGKIIGACGYHTWYLQHSRAEIGYALNDDAHKNKGYMKEAIKAVLDYGFNDMQLNRVEAFIGPKNEASIRLVTAMRFTREGLLRSHYCKNGRMEDSAVYGLLKTEYLNGKAY